MTTEQTGLSNIRLAFATLAGVGLLATCVLWPAGTFRWTAGWLYIGIIAVYMLVNVIYLNRVNPGLIEARMRIGKGTKTWDRVWGVLFAPVFLAIFVIAGFDAVRFGWSVMPAWLWFIGLAIFIPGTVLFSWSMGVNPFFEKTVRIQTDRGHHVIEHGPYQFVRHPGYLGFFSWCLATPLLLGSWWALVPGALSVIGIAVRTALEDRTLKAELAGYSEYASKVRYRLVPGVW